MPASGPTIGIDLGGTKILAAVVDGAGGVVAEERVDTPRSADAIVAALAGLVRTLGLQRAAAVGVGAAGLVDRRGAVRFAPNIPGFVRVEVRERLSEATGMSVVVDNDANVAARGEIVYGAARGCDDALVVTLGTGIGGAIVAGGQIYRGAHGYAAEIGHVLLVGASGPRCACGQTGHWEAIASGTALGQIGQAFAAEGNAPSVLDRAGGDVARITGEHVGAAALAGAADALAIIHQFADNVALGLAALSNVLDPGTIVIGGGLIELGEVLLEPVREAFSRHVEGAPYREPIAIVGAALGERAGVIGAAVLARELL
jgi:glucokinase